MNREGETEETSTDVGNAQKRKDINPGVGETSCELQKGRIPPKRQGPRGS